MERALLYPTALVLALLILCSFSVAKQCVTVNVIVVLSVLGFRIWRKASSNPIALRTALYCLRSSVAYSEAATNAKTSRKEIAFLKKIPVTITIKGFKCEKLPLNDKQRLLLSMYYNAKYLKNEIMVQFDTFMCIRVYSE